MIDIGLYVEGEVPSPVVVKFEISPGVPLDLSGYTARWVMARQDSDAPAIVKVAVVNDPSGGLTTYEWVDGDLAEGSWRAEMWVSNGVRKLCSERWAWVVEPALANPY